MFVFSLKKIASIYKDNFSLLARTFHNLEPLYKNIELKKDTTNENKYEIL
jgi:hypothetical protein